MRDSHANGLDEVWKEVDLLVDDERYVEAEERLRQSLLENPESVDLMTRLGEILAYQHREREAEKMFRKVLSMEPSHEAAVSLLGRLLDNSLRVSEAEGLFRETLEKWPSSHCVHEDLCRLLYDEGRAEEALELARAQIGKYPSTPEAYNSLRYVLVRREEDLEDELVESGCAPEYYVEQAKNAVIQYDVLTSLESALSSDVDDEIVKDVQGDIFRVVGDLEDIRDKLAHRKGKLSSELKARIKQIVAEGKARRKLL